MKSVQFTFKELQERNDSLNIQSVLIQIRYCNWGGTITEVKENTSIRKGK